MSVKMADNHETVVIDALASLGELTTLPVVTIKIIEIVERPDGTARELHDVIRHDPALSARILRVVNSAFYGLPGQVGDVDRATLLLGGAAVKNIAVAASLTQMFNGRQHPHLFHAKELWRHSVAVGVAAQGIARISTGEFAPDEIFLAGLIHDLGLLAARQVFPDKLADVCRRCNEGERNFLQLELDVIGATHQDLGKALMTKWRFPDQLRAAAGSHHNPETLPSELQPVAMVLHCADVLCCREKLGLDLTAGNEECSQGLLDALGITVDQLAEVRDGLASAVQEAEAMLDSDS